MKNGHNQNIYLTWEENGIHFTNSYSPNALDSVFEQFKELYKQGYEVKLETR